MFRKQEIWLILLPLFFFISCSSLKKKEQVLDDHLLEFCRVQKKYSSPYDAILFYSEVDKECHKSADSRISAMLYFDMAELYGETLNWRKEKEYNEKGLELLEKGDSLYIDAILRLANTCQKLEEWEKAESLYQEGFSNAPKDKLPLTKHISNYARMKLEQPEPDPVAAKQLLSSKQYSDCTLEDMAMSAYAAYLLNQNEECDEILNQLSRLSIAERRETQYWEYKIYKMRGDDATVSRILLNMFEDQEDLLKVNSLNSSPTHLADYYRRESDLEREKLRVQKLSFLLIALITAILLATVIIMLERSRKKALSKVQSVLSLYEETKEDNYSLRKEFVSLYEQQFAQLGELCEAYIHTDKVGALYHKMRFLLGDLQSNEELFRQLEKIIDAGREGIVSHLRNEIEGVTEQDIRFFCFNMLGLSNDSIAVLTGVETSTVYSRRSRLKKRILAIDSPHRDDFLSLIH